MIYTMTLNPALDYVMHPLTLDMGFTNRSSYEELYCGGNGINVSTLLNELGFNPDAIERQLAHQGQGVRAIYNLAKQFNLDINNLYGYFKK